jgi:quinol monooxygenase YgiN
MSQVVVVARFVVAEGREEEAMGALAELAGQTHAEAGCLTYALHRAKDDPRTLVLVERWTSQIALDNHFLQPYVAQVGERAGELLAAPPEVTVLEPVVVGDPVKGSL